MGKTLREIADAFGPEFSIRDGSLNRSLLGTRVFADEAARRNPE